VSHAPTTQELMNEISQLTDALADAHQDLADYHESQKVSNRLAAIEQRLETVTKTVTAISESMSKALVASLATAQLMQQFTSAITQMGEEALLRDAHRDRRDTGPVS
jgi:predicted  nucleic acid-binding Zn-ribbon protein